MNQRLTASIDRDIEPRQLYGVPEVRRFLEYWVVEETIRQYCRMGKLRAKRIDSRWRIPGTEVLRLRREWGLSDSSPDFEATFDLDRPVAGSTIIVASSFVNQALLEYWQRNPNDLRLIDRRRFEELVAELFSGFGYEVELTRQTRDGGKDIIAVKRSEVAVKFLIECKRPDPGHLVGVGPVRELHSVKVTEGATKAILATTTSFTRDALQLFHRHRWELEPRDFHAIQQWIHEYLQLRARRLPPGRQLG